MRLRQVEWRSSAVSFREPRRRISTSSSMLMVESRTRLVRSPKPDDETVIRTLTSGTIY
jgi:hypothetical protein